MVSLHRDTGYQHLEELAFWGSAAVSGLSVKLKQVPFLVKLFKIMAPNGHIDWVITNDLERVGKFYIVEYQLVTQKLSTSLSLRFA